MGRLHFVTSMLLILLQGTAGCDGGNSAPSPGDPCDVLNVEKCSANHLYLLRCDEESGTGELHYRIHEECDAEIEICSKDGEGNPACICDDLKCKALCAEAEAGTGFCYAYSFYPILGDCSCLVRCSDIQEGQECSYDLYDMGCCTPDGQNALLCRMVWTLEGPCTDGCSSYEGVEEGYVGPLHCYLY
jgi:hypothetical protein